MRAIGLWCYDKNRQVVAMWVAAVVVMGVLAGAFGGSSANDFTLPNTESQRALDLLQSKFPAASGENSQLVFHVQKGTLQQRRAQIEAVVDAVRKAPTVLQAKSGVGDPFAAVSKDGRTAFATITHNKTAADLQSKDVKKMLDVGLDGKAAKAAQKAGVEVEFGGGVVQYASGGSAPIGEIFGIIVALALLYVVLGAFSTAVLPLLTALFAVATGLGAITLLMSLFAVADFATFLMVLIATGVGIDYGLLVLSRVRNEMGKGYDARVAVGSAIDTAGRSVLFAGITVCIALCGMFVLGLSFLNGPAIGSAIGVALTMAATLTLLPALVASRPFSKRLKVGDMVNPDEESHFWARYSRFTQRHPTKLLVLGLVIIGLAASPVLGMRLASTDAGNGPKDNTARKAYDLLAKGFGPGFNGPFIAAVELNTSGDTKAELAQLRTALKGDRGVASVGEPTVNAAGDTATISIIPNSKPQDQVTTDTLKRIRDQVLPPVEQSTGAKVSIGGFTAGNVDFARVLAGKLPLFIGVIVGLSLLLLLVVFRSIAIPIKAGICNILSIGTALGFITWVFQHGHLGSVFGISETGPIEPFLPVMMFAIIFGLSMDYEVFLVSRMHEEWERTKDSAFAVRHGLALTGKVITAAGLIMISVFLGFSFTDDTGNKLFGLGFAAAIFFDAFVIRMLIVPSVMFLLGKRSWWLPGWLNRVLPRVSIEPHEQKPATENTAA